MIVLYPLLFSGIIRFPKYSSRIITKFNDVEIFTTMTYLIYQIVIEIQKKKKKKKFNSFSVSFVQKII